MFLGLREVVEVVSDSWVKWDFEGFEGLLAERARIMGREYDPGFPLAHLPEASARTALRAIGATYAEICACSGFTYKTVAGWFRPKGRPGRRTVAEGIFPALCEMYSAKTARGAIRLSRAEALHRTEVVVLEPENAYYREVEARVYFLIAEGELLPEDEARMGVSDLRDEYYRSALAMAAGQLHDEGLAVAARVALRELAGQAWEDTDDTLDEAIRITELFSAHSDRPLSAKAAREGISESDVLRELRSRLDKSSAHMASEGARAYLAHVSDEGLAVVETALRKEITYRRALSHGYAA